MSIHTAEIAWHRHDAVFTDNRYSRLHKWTFDGGAVVPGSSSPHVVRVPLSEPTAVDPEEAYVAALSSCHMLWFLNLAAVEGFVVDSYVDQAEGLMARNDEGRDAMTVVTLKPIVTFSGEKAPTDAALEQLHHAAHESCFLASSVKTQILVAGSWIYH
ncbi:OsmC family protein [Pseudoduganella sp. UC29_106]|uniref:OsmC family protein n=1 Tax=Pseudoduganella sp. UC29_106 TaxID=3374553 RepID=UPI003756CFFB